MQYLTQKILLAPPTRLPVALSKQSAIDCFLVIVMSTIHLLKFTNERNGTVRYKAGRESRGFSG